MTLASEKPIGFLFWKELPQGLGLSIAPMALREKQETMPFKSKPKSEAKE
jgi:hypothetical protein